MADTDDGAALLAIHVVKTQASIVARATSGEKS